MNYKTSFNNLPPEAWQSLTGENIETAPLMQTWRESGYLARAVDICADSLADVPFDIVDAAGSVVDTSEEYKNFVGVLPDLQKMLWYVEACIKLFGAAYLYRVPSVVRGKTARIRVLSPAALKVDIDENGTVTYKRRNAQQTPIPAELITPIWEQDPFIELGAPLSSSAERAAIAAGVLVNVDRFAEKFFKRGAIKGTIFGVETVDPVEREKFKSWVERLFNGVANAWRQAVFNMRGVTPIVIGEGLESLSNAELSTEKIKAILSTLGVPHSLVISDAANYATAQQDKRNFYSNLIIPDATMIEQGLNVCLAAIGVYRLRFAPDRLPVMAETNAEKAKAALDLAQVLNYGALGYVALDVAGYPLTDEQRAMIERALLPAPQTQPTQPQLPPPAPVPDEQDAARQSDDADTEPRGDLLKWQKKALKALDKTGSAVCSFESDEMPSAARGMIERGLAAIKSGDEVKILFAVASEWRDYP